jgi:hypothetical protein
MRPVENILKDPESIFLTTPKIYAHADGGPCSRSAHAPNQQERKFSSARVSRVTFKHLPQSLRTHIQSFGTLRQLLKFNK